MQSSNECGLRTAGDEGRWEKEAGGQVREGAMYVAAYTPAKRFPVKRGEGR
jgi:hypothetical protein